MGRLTLALAIATRGRPEVVERLIAHAEAQSRPADLFVISASSPADVRSLAPSHGGLETQGRIEVIYGEAGVSAQRNRALDRLEGRADLVLFLDDDFVPAPGCFAAVERLFASRPRLAAATGLVLADGAHGAPIGDEEASRMVASFEARARDVAERPVIGLYGCNMAIRASAARGLRFDEALPLYAWQEDLDFGARLRRRAGRGSVIRTAAFGGVHRGVKTGRSPQRGLGYAQIANPVHLMSGGAVPRWFLLRMMARNVAANLMGAVRPDPWSDRRGRLSGNLIALSDLARGRLAPARAASL